MSQLTESSSKPKPRKVHAMFFASMPAASRRYQKRFLSSMLVYAIVFMAATWIFKHHHPTGLAIYALAIAPAVPLLAGIAAVGLYIAEEQDEFVRMLFVRSVLWGVGATLGICTVIGFLQAFDAIQSFPLYHIYVMFWIFTGLAQGIQQALYRSHDE